MKSPKEKQVATSVHSHTVEDGANQYPAPTTATPIQTHARISALTYELTRPPPPTTRRRTALPAGPVERGVGRPSLAAKFANKKLTFAVASMFRALIATSKIDDPLDQHRVIRHQPDLRQPPSQRHPVLVHREDAAKEW